MVLDDRFRGNGGLRQEQITAGGRDRAPDRGNNGKP
jgi:hypothetical protein